MQTDATEVTVVSRTGDGWLDTRGSQLTTFNVKKRLILLTALVNVVQANRGLISCVQKPRIVKTAFTNIVSSNIMDPLRFQ